MKADCPLLTSSPVHNPTPTTLHITDGCQGKAKAPKAWGRAFQLTIEETMATLNVIVGMCSFILMLFYFIHDYNFLILLGTFLLNFVLGLVLFVSGASQSFVSTSFSWCFNVPYEPLDRP